MSHVKLGVTHLLLAVFAAIFVELLVTPFIPLPAFLHAGHTGTSLVSADTCDGSQKTGVGLAGHYQVSVGADCVLLVEGVAVSVNGVARTNGVFVAFSGPGNFDLEIQDGEWVRRLPSFAQQDFCARVNRAVQADDLHNNVSPLPEWPIC